MKQRIDCLRKEVKKTGRQLAIIFSSEESRIYKLEQGENIRITIEKIKEE